MRLSFLRTALPVVLALGLTLPLTTLTAQAAQVAGAGPARRITYTEWSGPSGFAAGHADGVRVNRAGKLVLGATDRSKRFRDPDTGSTGRYEFGRWTSPWVSPGFGLTDLIPSWDATTRGDSFIQVQVRTRTSAGRGSWDTVAWWAADDHDLHRTTTASGAESDDLGGVNTDTWVSHSGEGVSGWQVRLTLSRASGTRATPRVRTIGAMASRLPDASTVPTSAPGVARGIVLPVPSYSQMTHTGEYPGFGGGGEAWCSPTSTTMVLGYYGRLPAPRHYAWVSPSYSDRYVDHAARMAYDYEYEGTGNWAFTTAYAASRTKHAFVTRLRSLREAESFIRAGIPLVASIAFGRGELAGAPISASNGHLVVIAGFTEDGDVVVNDPAADSNPGVRRVYDRGQFENAWLPASGGTVYVVRDDAHPLPFPRRHSNW